MNDETLKTHYIWQHSTNEKIICSKAFYLIIIQKDATAVCWNLKILV